MANKTTNQKQAILVEIGVKANSPVPGGHKLHIWGSLRVLHRHKDVKDEAAILVRGSFRADDHNLDDIKPVFVHTKVDSRIKCEGQRG